MFLASLIVIVSFVVVKCQPIEFNQHQRELYERVFQEFIKNYKNGYERADEDNDRFRIIVKNLKKVTELQNGDKLVTKYGMHHYADLTAGEIKKLHETLDTKLKSKYTLNNREISNLKVRKIFDGLLLKKRFFIKKKYIQNRQNVDETYKQKNTYEKEFKKFIRKYGKLYSSDSEYEYRFKVFVQNLKKANKMEKRQKGTAKYGVTQFADLTEDEFLHREEGTVEKGNKWMLKRAEVPNGMLPKRRKNMRSPKSRIKVTIESREEMDIKPLT